VASGDFMGTRTAPAAAQAAAAGPDPRRIVMPTKLAVRRSLSAAALVALLTLPGAVHARTDARHAAVSDPEYGAAYRQPGADAGGLPVTLPLVGEEIRRAAAHDPEYTGAYLVHAGEPRVLSGAPAAGPGLGAASDPENVAAYATR
jgi:hypothetical protein